MKLHDDYYEEEHSSGSRMTYVYMALIMSVVILGVTALVFWANQPHSRSDGSGYAAALAQKEAQAAEASRKMEANASENVIAESKLTSDDLDIWTLPDTGREKNTSQSNRNNGTVTNQTTGETVIDGSANASDSTGQSKTADELSNGKTSVYDMTKKEEVSGEKESESETVEEKEEDKDDEKEEVKSIQVKHADGTKEWVDVNTDIARNKYNYSNLKYKKPIMNYYEDGTIVSKCGVDISANQGDVDFSKLKNAGCDFVMLKVGARGYSSGNIVSDANFRDNLKAAKKAGLDIGVYFCSQAINKSEAREEADEVLDAISGYSIKYPVAFVMENVDEDMARIEALDMTERTQIAKAFMNRIEDAGYKAMIYGDKEWLLTMVDMEKLQDYDVWFAQDSDEPEYPYEFGMWQYDSDAAIKGITGDAIMIMSFKDYAK
ncbi:MAG: glycoside hydrolase family 25 protein [Lachnospiraceae bacterium]|nr:glycoside hydrolase family 25 protein [Lachnospiraceae bacterium]